MADFAKFEKDLDWLVTQLSMEGTPNVALGLAALRDRLVELHRLNMAKINHSVMELVCAKYLILKGYSVQIEHSFDEELTCDLFGTKGFGTHIVEVETGFIPPDHALDPMTWVSARIASKIIRYSVHAEKFSLAIPPHYVLPFQKELAKLPKQRSDHDIRTVKNLCDLYYRNPPITIAEIRQANLNSIYIVDVDKFGVREIDPESYSSSCRLD